MKDLLIKKYIKITYSYVAPNFISSFAGAHSYQFPLDFQCAFKETIQIPPKQNKTSFCLLYYDYWWILIPTHGMMLITKSNRFHSKVVSHLFPEELLT